MKKYSFLLIWLLNSNCHSQNIEKAITILPKDFKTETPFKINERGIFINTYWGKDKIEHLLYWDNHSPSWADFNIIKDSTSLKKSKLYKYKTTTAAGTSIHGEVYICSLISLGNVSFGSVPFYNIVHQTYRGRDDKIYGAFGEELIKKGIWKIDFRNKIITFTSSIDSLKELSEANLLSSNFKNDFIELDLYFSNKIRKTLQVDLG